MLIETPEGVLNTHHVVSAKPIIGAKRSDRCSVILADGTSTTVDVGIEALLQACGVIVPAHPGFTVITALLPDPNETGIIYGEEPVIAFRVGHGETYGAPLPITIAGEPSIIGGTLWTTRQPNGVCFGPDHVHASLDDFKAECEREVTRRLAGAA